MNILPIRAFLVLIVTVVFCSCNDKWEEHNAVDNSVLSESLASQISKKPELSEFAKLLKATKYDSLLATSKTFTVWAPTNDALKEVDPTLLDSEQELELFVGNHLAYQTIATVDAKAPFIRVKTLNGKNVSFSASTVDDASIVSRDSYLGNGILHTINKAIIPKLSAWEYLMSLDLTQKSYLQSLNQTVRDLSKAKQIGVDPKTGDPIYEDGSGMVTINSFLQRSDISSEDSLYTYIVLTNEAFTNEKNKLSKYYVTSTQDSTESITNFSIVKDLAFKGVLDANNFPAVAYSVRDSVKFHLNKNAIVATKRVSNGIVYVMNNIDYDIIGANGNYDPYTKIKPIVIQGENPFAFQSSRTTSYRLRRDPNNGQTFRDILIQNHGQRNYWINYRTGANSTRYKVYWRAVNDFQTAIFQMKVAFKRFNETGFTGLTDVTPLNYGEVYLGEYSVDRLFLNNTSNPSNGLNLFLVGPDLTTNGLNTLVLDYIKLVPVQ